MKNDHDTNISIKSWREKKKKKKTAEKFLAYAEQKQKAVIHGKKDRPIRN